MTSLTPIEARYEELVRDNVSGSSDLAVKLCRFFEEFSTSDQQKLKTIAKSIYAYFTGMGLVRNTLLELLTALENDEDIAVKCQEIQLRMNSQSSTALEQISPLFSRRISVATISRSSQVSSALVKYSDRIREVYVLESRPMLEGFYFHLELLKKGLRSILLTDASMGEACRMADLCLVGCDSLLGDGTLIHKAGTLPLFSTIHYYSKCNYAIGLGMKEERNWTMDTYPEFREHPCNELGLEDGSCWNRYFEKVPYDLIDGVCTETGIRKYNTK